MESEKIGINNEGAADYTATSDKQCKNYCSISASKLNLDELLKTINEFGKAQKLIVALSSFMMLPSVYQSLIMIFIGNNPSWVCSPNDNSTYCGRNGTFSIGDEYYETRCFIPRSAWEFTKPEKYSIITKVYNLC